MKTNKELKTGNLRKSNLIQILKTLSKEEMKAFDKFVRSPFHNNRNEVTRYFLQLKKYYPSFPHQELITERIYKKIYPGKTYKDNVMRRLSSNLFQLTQDFLAHNTLNAYSFAKKYYVIKELDRCRLDNLFLTNFKKLEGELNSSKQGYDSDKEKGELEHAIINFHLARNNQHKIQNNILRRGEYYVNTIIRWLELQVSDVLMNKNNYGKTNEPDIAEAFISNINLAGFSGWLNENMCPQFTYTAILCNLLLMDLHPENESYYFKSKKLILDNLDLFDDEMKKMHIYTLRNYCSSKDHNIIFIKEIFELDKIMCQFARTNFLDFGIYFESIPYLEAVRNALALDEIRWTEEFINDFSQYIHHDERESNRNLALALLAFKKSEFEGSLKYLNQVKLTTPTIKPIFKWLILRVYYELDMIEPGLSAIDSMHHFINNTKEVGIGIKKILLSKINIITELFKLKFQPEKIDKIAVSKLKADIEKAPFPLKSWYFEKVEELEAKAASKNQRTLSSTKSLYQKSKIG